jgi:acyl carrier protein
MPQHTDVAREIAQSVFIDILGLAEPIDWATVRYQEIEAWDSLAHMAIVGELEDRFGIMLDTDDVLDMSSFDKALEILAKYGAGSEG